MSRFVRSCLLIPLLTCAAGSDARATHGAEPAPSPQPLAIGYAQGAFTIVARSTVSAAIGAAPMVPMVPLGTTVRLDAALFDQPTADRKGSHDAHAR